MLKKQYSAIIMIINYGIIMRDTRFITIDANIIIYKLHRN